MRGLKLGEWICAAAAPTHVTNGQVADAPRPIIVMVAMRHMVPGMGSPELQRKVRQHDNDLAAIYEILTEHGDDLTEIKLTLADHGAKLADHGAKLAEVGSKLDELSSTVNGQGSKLDELLALLRGGPEGTTPRA
ncbi:MAG: hypothetical protein ACRDTE_20730 [Pseudonocardiaceae bacterium]